MFWQPMFERSGFEKKHVLYVHTFRSAAEASLSAQQRAKDNNDYYDLGRHAEEGRSRETRLAVRLATAPFVKRMRALAMSAPSVSTGIPTASIDSTSESGRCLAG